MRAVAERLVAGLAASAQRHFFVVLDDPAIRRHQPDRTGHYVRAVLTGDDRHIWHGRLLSTYSKGLADRQPADSDTGKIEHRVGDRRRHERNADLSDTARLLRRIDEMNLDGRSRPHSHQRVAVEVLGHDLAGVAENDFAPQGGTEPEQNAPLDLSANKVRGELEPAVEREYDALDMDALLRVCTHLDGGRGVALESFGAGKTDSASTCGLGPPAATIA